MFNLVTKNVFRLLFFLRWRNLDLKGTNLYENIINNSTLLHFAHV